MRRGGRWVFYLAILLLLTGCWGRLEVNDLGMGTGMAIDKGKEKEVRLTIYLARGMAGGKGGEPVWAVTREASTIADALIMINHSSSRRVSLEHLRVILVGEEYARSGMEDLLDFVARHSEIRLTTRFLVTQGEATTFLQTRPHLEALLPESIVKILEAKGGLNPRVKEFLVANIAETFSPWIYSAHLHGGSKGREIEIGGIGLFVGRRLVEILPPGETLALTWLLRKPSDGELSATCVGEPEKTFSVRVEDGSARITPTVTGDQASFHVKGKLKVVLVNSECTRSTITLPDQRSLFERQLETIMTQYMQSLLQHMQADQADPVGFGKVVQMRFPAFFRRNSSKWPMIWAQSKVTYDLKVVLHHSRFLLEPVNRTRQELRGTE